MDIEVHNISAKRLGAILASERREKRACRDYLLCKIAIRRRQKTLAALIESGQSTDAEEKMLRILLRSLAVHKKRMHKEQ